jgi:hypothetical protein
MALTNEDIDVYLFLLDRFCESSGEIDNDHVFHFLFRSYYRMDNAGLSIEFKTEYFKIMRNCFNDKITDVEIICLKLSKYKNLRNQNTVQFSFATKLAAMIDPELPLFDQYIGKMYGFNPPYVPTIDDRLKKHIAFYNTLKESVQWLKQQKEYLGLQGKLAIRLANWTRLSTTKQADFILWSGGKLKMDKNRKKRGT